MAQRPPSHFPICSPFDAADADITLRSSDGVDFRLYKVILAKASPVFRSMLALPQPSSATSDGTNIPKHSEDIVNVTEDAKTLEHVFRLCYPVERGPSTGMTISDIHAVVEAAQKYEMTGTAVLANTGDLLLKFLPADPWRVYALAYSLQLKDIAKEAALLLNLADLRPPLYHIPEVRRLPCGAIYPAHEYRRECLEAVVKVLKDNDWILTGAHENCVLLPGGRRADSSRGWLWVTCRLHETCLQDRDRLSRRVDPHGNLLLRSWFATYYKSLGAALEKCPSRHVVRTYLVYNQDNEALKKAKACCHCGPRAYTDLQRFSELLAERADEAVSQVEIKLD